VRAVQEQVVQLYLVQTPAAPGVELVADGLAHPRHGRLDRAACGPKASARQASTSRTDSPRTNPAITNVSTAFVLDTPVPNNRDTNKGVATRAGRRHLTK
jgi:hypothetical protein